MLKGPLKRHVKPKTKVMVIHETEDMDVVDVILLPGKRGRGELGQGALATLFRQYCIKVLQDSRAGRYLTWQTVDLYTLAGLGVRP